MVHIVGKGVGARTETQGLKLWFFENNFYFKIRKKYSNTKFRPLTKRTRRKLSGYKCDNTSAIFIVISKTGFDAQPYKKVEI